MRHAHAQWPAWRGSDFDRPLTDKGMKDAAAAASAIAAARPLPGLIITSPALRTRMTASIVATELGLANSAVQAIDSLYNASADTIELELRRAAIDGTATLVVGHNPGITEAARLLSGNAKLASMRPAQWLSGILA